MGFAIRLGHWNVARVQCSASILHLDVVIPIIGFVRLLIHKPVHNYFDPYGEFKAAMCWAYIKIEFTVPQIQMPASAAR